MSQWPPQQSQYPQHPPKLSWWQQHWQQFSPAEQIVVVAVSGLVATALVCGCSYVGLAALFTPAQPSSSQLTSSPIVQSTVGPPSATDTPTSPPTATPKGPRPLTGATIGGVQDSFTSAFGDPRVQGSASRYSFTTADGRAAIVQIQTQNGMDRQPHMAFLTEAPNGSGPWTVNQSQAVARLFMPPDTKHVRDFTDPQLGTIQVYQSADLAATFPAADFTDSGTGAALPPGTFGLSCGDQTAGCGFVLGD